MLSGKQLAMAWLNTCLEPERINPEIGDFEKHNQGNPITEKRFQEAKEHIFEICAKLKADRFQPYVDKYCK